jgi:hypothetical protein
MNTYTNMPKAMANLISKVQEKPSTITSKRAFSPHYDVISKDYTGNHQNWNDGGFTNHH